ncbi:DUF3429 domain-containing protein [Marinicella sp. W31]|uniref:DUF3429 domain-containing protein n=1 Tax=Marinicella sp. W31 TaxID=3023713 RepID=UPI003757B978
MTIETTHSLADRQAKVLTYLGAIPFIIAVLIGLNIHVSFPEILGGDIAYASFKAKALVHSYAVVILSFLGGIQWGISLREPVTRRLYIVSNVIALAAWLSLIVFTKSEGLIIVLLGFIVALWVDQKAHNRGMIPSWFWQLRIKVTAIVCLSLLLIIALTW